jgi:hypothetical protein
MREHPLLDAQPASSQNYWLKWYARLVISSLDSTNQTEYGGPGVSASAQHGLSVILR